MNKRKSFPLIFMLVLIGTASCLSTKKVAGPTVSVFPFSDTVTLRNGTLIYALPRTVLTVNVETERTIEVPGPYSAYAGDLLGLGNVITSGSESWSIRGVSVSANQEADPEQYFVIRTNSVFQSNVLELKNEGLILDITPGLLNEGMKSFGAESPDYESFRSFDLGSDEYYLAQNDTAYRRVALDSTFIRIPYVVEKKKRLTTAQLAERAARRLMELRDGKIMILTGETNVFPQNEAAINEINKLIKDYTELFTGKTITETRKFTYQYIPDDKPSAGTVTLFKLSEQTGPGNPESRSGTPVVLSITPEKKTININGVSPGEVSGTSGDKLFYRIPDIATIRLSHGNEILYTSRKMIFQFGELMEMPANYLINK